jgi:hypothetical protein
MSSISSSHGSPVNTFIPATRIQHSLVANVEKHTLLWLAEHTPGWIHSDHLTLLGFMSQCLVGFCYALSRLNPDMLLAGIVCLALNWLGDSLDGTLARVRNRQRPRYGFYVDLLAGYRGLGEVSLTLTEQAFQQNSNDPERPNSMISSNGPGAVRFS